MTRIMIIGCSGAGKSTLTRHLAAVTGFPVLHLDRIWHAMELPDKARFRAAQADFLARHEDAIVDGNYGSSLDIRLAVCDEVVWLQISRQTALYRVLRRSLSNRLFHNRTDMPEGFKEKWDKDFRDFLRFVWTFPDKEEPQIRAAITATETRSRLILLTNKKEIKEYIQKYAKKEN